MKEDNTPEPASPASNSDPDTLRRREFLQRLSVGAGCLAGLGIAAPAVGFIIGPLLQRIPQNWREVGKVSDFQVGATTNVTFIDASPLPWSGVTAKTAAWLRRVSGEEFIAFSVNCTHLGCPVRWKPEAKLFLCPCHGGVYYQDGKVAGGPPPLPLPRYQVRVRDDRVEILTGPVPITTV